MILCKLMLYHTRADLCPSSRTERSRTPKSPPTFLHVGANIMSTLLDVCVSSLRRGHANLLCIVPILTHDPRRESEPPHFLFACALRATAADGPPPPLHSALPPAAPAVCSEGGG